jgi:hypothetical protein
MAESYLNEYYRPGTYLLRVQHESGKKEVHRVVRQ